MLPYRAETYIYTFCADSYRLVARFTPANAREVVVRSIGVRPWEYSPNTLFHAWPLKRARFMYRYERSVLNSWMTVVWERENKNVYAK